MLYPQILRRTLRVFTIPLHPPHFCSLFWTLLEAQFIYFEWLVKLYFHLEPLHVKIIVCVKIFEVNYLCPRCFLHVYWELSILKAFNVLRVHQFFCWLTSLPMVIEDLIAAIKWACFLVFLVRKLPFELTHVTSLRVKWQFLNFMWMIPFIFFFLLLGSQGFVIGDFQVFGRFTLAYC